MKNLSVPNHFLAMISKSASSLLPSQSIIELEKIEKSKFRSVKGGYSLIRFLLWAIMFWLLFSLGFVLQTNPSTQTAVSLINHCITVAVPLRFLSCRVFFRCSLRCCCRRYVSDYGFLFLLHQLTPIGPKMKLRSRQFSSSALWFGDVIWIFDPGIIGFWNCNQSKWLVIWTADIQNKDRNCINFVVQIYKLSRAIWFEDEIWLFDPGIFGAWNDNEDDLKTWFLQTPVHNTGYRPGHRIWWSEQSIRLCLYLLVVPLKLWGLDMEFTQAALVVRRWFVAYSQGIRRSWYRMEKETKSKFVQMTMIQKFWYLNVNISELIWKHQVYHAVSKHGVSAKKCIHESFASEQDFVYLLIIWRINMLM